MPTLLLILACSRAPAPTWAVHEAFDVPPPPGAVSLDLGPVASSVTYAPGDRVRLTLGEQTTVADVVDVQTADAKTTLTVYAPAAVAEAWVLAPRPVRLVVRPVSR